MTFDVYVAAEGFSLENGWVIKELTLLFYTGEFVHVLLQPPKDFKCSEKDETTIRYTTHHLNGLNFDEGETPYECLGDILSKLRNCRVYCYGEASRRLLQSHLPYTPVHDTQEMGFSMPAIIPTVKCGRLHRGRYCSMAKTAAIRDSVKQF